MRVTCAGGDARHATPGWRPVLGTLAALGLLLGSGAAPARAVVGDMDCSGCTNFDDIDGFVLAVISQEQYEAAYPDCDWLNGDGNGDGRVDFDDIDFFVLAVIAGGGGTVQTELAGNPLTQYPHFEYVRAIMSDAPVHVAIDIARFPSLAGRNVDLYVVAQGATSLVDLTPGGPLNVTLGGSTIQENTFRVADPGDLSGDGGADIGVGYDVIIDANRNGIIDCGDYRDGGGNQAGFYVVGNLTQGGPYPVTLVSSYAVSFAGLGSFTLQTVSYPTNIAELGPRPLVAISHGVGHNYQGYVYLQNYLSSYGYIVMAHQNNVGSIPNAANTCQRHTDAFFANLPSIAGGALVGLVDGSKIAWIGHSRGGECVALAYDNIFDGRYVPENYTLADLKLISSIAPTAFQGDAVGGDRAETHNGTYHLIYGAADADVSGAANCSQCQSFRLYERATGKRFSTYIQGVGHNDFFCCGSSVASGPDLIGRPATQDIAKVVWLCLLEHLMEGSPPALDFLTRQWETLRPVGTLAAAVVTNEYKDALEPGRYVIDDFQTQASTAISSSGGAVTFSVNNLTENQMRETDGTFAWSAGNPMNGMTRADPTDLTRGVVFDWSAGQQRFLRFEIAGGPRDFRDYVNLSFRAAQITRHPETLAVLADLTFTATLEDADGTESTINIGAYGGGIEQTYTRSGGWQNEMETIRIRLTDFLHNSSGLDLSRIAAVRFDFGSSSGSAQGRIAMDDIEMTRH